MSANDFAHLPRKKLGRPSLLTESQISDIVTSYLTNTAKELALKHNCSPWNIKRIWAKHSATGKSRRKYLLDLNYFEVIDSPDKAYFLGFIAADGCVRKPLRGPLALSIKVSSKDEQILFDLLKCMKSNNAVSRSCYTTPWKRVVKEASYVTLISAKLCADLARHNVCERKTRDYEPVPLPSPLMPHFIRGYFDGDGTVYKIRAKSGERPSHYRFAICVNERTGRFFQSCLERNGINCTLVNDKASSIFQLRISDSVSKERFVRFIYGASEGLCLLRKKRRADEFMSSCKGQGRG